jgi:hypothetical protein
MRIIGFILKGAMYLIMTLIVIFLFLMFLSLILKALL